jgi:spermidine/putrescine transport system substrate-binding protein
MKHHEFDVDRTQTDFNAGQLSRRQALKAHGAAGIAAGAMPLIAGGARADTQPIGPGGIPLARPDKPVTLPLHGKPIKSALQPETGGTFKLFNYQDYIYKKLVDDFGKKYGVAMELSTFDTMDQAITRMASHTVEPDVTNISNQRLAQAVAGKLLMPINLDYVPNLKRNIWPSLHSPFYDVGSRYTIPYTTYSTGIGWRADKVSEDIANMGNPWSIFWKSEKYKGYVGILNDTREALGLAMLYRGFYDINTEDPAVIEKALADLKTLIPICSPKINTTQSRTLAAGESWLHQANSGDLLGAFFSDRPAGYDGSSLRFWSPPKGKGPVDNDCWAILSTTEKPVLAHLWLNYLLDQNFAYSNFIFSGYQPPQVSITVDSLIERKIIPDNLRTTIFTTDTFGSGSIDYATLTPKGEALWQKAYARFNSGT